MADVALEMAIVDEVERLQTSCETFVERDEYQTTFPSFYALSMTLCALAGTQAKTTSSAVHIVKKVAFFIKLYSFFSNIHSCTHPLNAIYKFPPYHGSRPPANGNFGAESNSN